MPRTPAAAELPFLPDSEFLSLFPKTRRGAKLTLHLFLFYIQNCLGNKGQSLVQISNKILNILNTNAQPDQTVG